MPSVIHMMPNPELDAIKQAGGDFRQVWLVEVINFSFLVIFIFLAIWKMFGDTERTERSLKLGNRWSSHSHRQLSWHSVRPPKPNLAVHCEQLRRTHIRTNSLLNLIPFNQFLKEIVKFDGFFLRCFAVPRKLLRSSYSTVGHVSENRRTEGFRTSPYVLR